MRILLVDDNLDTVFLTAKLLERHHGCQVRYTDNPLSAAELAKEFRPDGIALDLGMPLRDGYSLARELREVPELRDCRIAAVSGYPPDYERLSKAGFDVHLLKPVASGKLIEALRQPVEA